MYMTRAHSRSSTPRAAELNNDNRTKLMRGVVIQSLNLLERIGFNQSTMCTDGNSCLAAIAHRVA